MVCSSGNAFAKFRLNRDKGPSGVFFVKLEKRHPGLKWAPKLNDTQIRRIIKPCQSDVDTFFNVYGKIF